ncbi:DUF1731 domain-containing protein [Lentibacillus halodurans]|uniref:DUF1731 domain-containing protein n=1 Tax=Lentibacillus halodurans TaxID=237679 RepID=UPI001FCD74E7|nr:DUF1731 domain-containing protein [Lentibacillus halodurans]
MKLLRTEKNIPFGLPSPEWLLEIGAMIIRTETKLVLKSRWIIPDRLEKESYTFTFNTFNRLCKI